MIAPEEEHVIPSIITTATIIEEALWLVLHGNAS
jgi:hypothetical protein